MRTRISFSIILFMFGLCWPQDRMAVAQSDIWVTAYYGGWSQGWFNNGVLPAEEIDYSAVTHIIHFALWPKADGTFDADANSIRESNSAALISRAHAAGKKVIISIGGWGSNVNFRSATGVLTLPTLVSNLVNFMTTRGYDGIDIDWETLELSDLPQYTLFIKALRAQLDQLTPRPLLTAAVAWQAGVFASLLNEFDQINLMSYDLSGAWPGWVVWHNGATTTQGNKFASNGRLLPSAETMINEFIAAGVPAKKLGIGIDFYGYIWSGGSGTSTGGVTAPGQSWTSAPSIQVNVPNYSILPTYYKPEYYRFDSVAQVSYLSIDNAGSANDKFVSYENEWAVARKIAYARSRGIGGVFIWELGGGYLPKQYSYRDRLLQSAKIAAQSISTTAGAPAPTAPANNLIGVSITTALSWSGSSGTSFYRLQVATDPSFLSIVYDQGWILWNSQPAKNLSPNQQYYWRVQPSNISGSGEWSAAQQFTTAANPQLPESWAYVAQTGSNVTVRIPAAATPKLGSRSLRTGDAVGVFYERSGVPICAGYGVWTDGQDLMFNVWGDNPSTSIKDGLATTDTLWFQIWDTQARREYIASATYQDSGKTFANGVSFILRSLTGFPFVRLPIVLAKGENMVSSFVHPADSSLSVMFAKIRPRMLALRDGQGGVYMPDSSINTIGSWRMEQGYFLYMKAADTLTVVGDEVAPEQRPVPLSTGWNLVPYLRNAPMRTDSALMSVANRFLLVKDLSGQVYWPETGFNQIGVMKPGQSYQIFMKEGTTMRYPSNASPSGELIGQGESQTMLPSLKKDDVLYQSRSGSSATLLVDAPDLSDGDEIWVRTPTLFVGNGTVSHGKALVVIWGDNRLSPELEGAKANDLLTLSFWSSTTRAETVFKAALLSNVLSGQAISELRYTSDAVWVAQMASVPSAFQLEQNYPNPFNPSTTIRYTLPASSTVTLAVYDLVGRHIATLVQKEQGAGGYSVVFQNPGLPSGVYVYSLTVETDAPVVNPFTHRNRVKATKVRTMLLLK